MVGGATERLLRTSERSLRYRVGAFQETNAVGRTVFLIQDFDRKRMSISPKKNKMKKDEHMMVSKVSRENIYKPVGPYSLWA